MDEIQVMKVTDSESLKKFYPVLSELRTHLSFEEFRDIYDVAVTESGYTLLGLGSQEKILAVMGYRILTDFVHGKHLYIDDLVSSESERSKGHGARLLLHAEELARNSGCKGLRLSTGIENEQGKKFYESNGWKLRAVVYKKALD